MCLCLCPSRYRRIRVDFPEGLQIKISFLKSFSSKPYPFIHRHINTELYCVPLRTHTLMNASEAAGVQYCILPKDTLTYGPRNQVSNHQALDQQILPPESQDK